MTNPIYLDYNATSPLLPVVRDAMAEVESLPLNASSVHAMGRLAKQRLETARTGIAHWVSAWPDEVIFTASGTEANNMALSGFPERVLMVAGSEHASVLEMAKSSFRTPAKQGEESQDAPLTPTLKDNPEIPRWASPSVGMTLPLYHSGLVDLEVLEQHLSQHKDNALVSVMLVNNETGIIQPIREIAALVHRYGGVLHCDAVQAVGKLAFDFTTLDVDMLTLAAHKVGGPVGVGALVVKNDLHLKPLLLGGGQEKRRRAGTENISAIQGFATLLENLPDLSPLATLQRQIETEILAVSPQSIIAGQGAARVGNTSNIITEGLSSELQLMHLDLAGICVSAGSACSSGRIEPSHVLQAMGYSKVQASSAIRISMGWNTQPAEVDALLAAWKKKRNSQ